LASASFGATLLADFDATAEFAKVTNKFKTEPKRARLIIGTRSQSTWKRSMAEAVPAARTKELIPIPTRSPFIAAKKVQILCSTANARLVHAITLRVLRVSSSNRGEREATVGIFVFAIDSPNLHKS
jgi:hypothetical protein